jgi:RimJ/RimL family protein N-acetyltransferase
MIYELNPSQFKSINHLLEGERINLEIKSVVEGYNPGWVFVDNVMDPQTALVWSRGIKGFYFLGDANSVDFNNSLLAYIKYIITPRVRRFELTSFEFSGTSMEWDKKLESLFMEKELNVSKQFVYRRPKELALDASEYELDEAFELCKIDQALLNRSELNLELVKDNVLEWWDDVNSFKKFGTGYCILHKNTAVCSCVASFYDGHEVESHIETLDEYRNQGLATVAVANFVDEARDSALGLYWDCMEKNKGSRAIAEKLGYEKSYEYKLYEFEI